MARLLCVFALLVSTSFAQRKEPEPGRLRVFQRFQMWGKFPTDLEKFDFLIGFTNGFFAWPRSMAYVSFAECIGDNIGTDQAIAMIDKYYRENPEKWEKSIASGIINALTVKGGPCEGKDPSPQEPAGTLP